MDKSSPNYHLYSASVTFIFVNKVCICSFSLSKDEFYNYGMINTSMRYNYMYIN